MELKPYHTSDTAEAAYLISHDCKLLRLNRLNGITEFELEDPGHGIIGELLSKWDAFICPEHKFYKAYRHLLSQIKKNDNFLLKPIDNGQ